MSDSNIDIEELLTLLYDSVYNNSLEGCFKNKDINLKNIDLNDIKISLKYSKLADNFLSQLENLSLKKIKNNTYECYGKIFPFILKISPYKKEKDLEDMSSGNNFDCLISYLFSVFVLNKITNHIHLPLKNFDIQLNKLEKIFGKDIGSSKFRELIDLGKLTDIFTVKIREGYFKSSTLENYFQKNGYSEFKNILFMLIHTLAIIQDKYPDFRHNNLSPLTIYTVENSKMENSYKYSSMLFKIPDKKIDIKISNFEYSYLNSKYFSRKAKKIDLFGKNNKYFDLYMFLSKIDRTKLSKQDMDFVNEIAPKKSDFMKKNKELFTPKNLLKHSYFREFSLNKTSKESFKGIKTRIADISHFGYQDNLLTPDLPIVKNRKNQKKISKSNKMITRKLKTSTKKRSKKISGTRKTPVFKNRKENKSKNKIEQAGGYRSFKPAYQFEPNKPEYSKDEKTVFKKRISEKPKPKVQQPKIIAEQKIYDVSKEKSTRPPYPPNFPPTHVPVPNPYYPIQNNLPYTYKPNQIPVQKFYNISLSNPAGDHTVLHHIFEDMMPSEDRFNFDTVYERMLFLNHMRNIILKEGDGEDMTIAGGKADTLLSFIRLMEINPYSSERNPYHDMSSEMMLFRAAYPIRYDRERDFISIAKQSTGLNVRIYRMSVGALLAKNLNQNINFYNFDVWRDIYYYEHIRENIVKKKVSPNFANLILYTMDKKSNFDWTKMEQIKKDNVNLFNFQQNEKNRQTVNLLHDYERNLSQLDTFLPMKQVSNALSDELQKKLDRELEEKWMIYNTDKNPEDRVTLEEFKRIRLIEEAKDDITRASNEALVAITESATSNIIRWASPVYESHGAVKKMISTGFHTDEVWFSVIFQMVSVFLVLNKEKIMFDELSLENNFYIKDMFSKPNNRGYWRYRVREKNGFLNYHIPNFGYLVLFDSRYSDLKHSETNLDKKGLTNENRRYKLYMKQFKDNGEGNQYYADADARDKDKDKANKLRKDILLDQLKELFRRDNFTKKFKIKGGGVPSDRVLNLLDQIANSRSINEAITDNFNPYLSQKAGEYLSVSEYKYIDTLTLPEKTVPGELVVYEEGHQTFIWGVIKKKENDRITLYLGGEQEKVVNINSLKRYLDKKVLLNKSMYVNTTDKKTLNYNPTIMIESYELL